MKIVGWGFFAVDDMYRVMCIGLGFGLGIGLAKAIGIGVDVGIWIGFALVSGICLDKRLVTCDCCCCCWFGCGCFLIGENFLVGDGCLGSTLRVVSSIVLFGCRRW